MKDIDFSSINVYLDELDISNRADIDSTYLSISDYPILPGTHTIRVNITNIFGAIA